MKIQAVFATKAGAPDWQEEFLTDHPERIEAAQEWARKNGFDRIRIATIDMDTPPNFAATINRK